MTNQSVIDYIKQESGNLNTIIENFDTFYESITVSPDGKTVSLVSKNYDTMVVSLERHVQNEIMNYCLKM